jgi:hypothetical protein
MSEVVPLVLRLTARRIGADNFSAGRLNQFAQLVQVLGAGVAEDEIAKAVVAPAADFEGKRGPHWLIHACLFEPLILENEERNLVLADAKN